MFLFQHVLSSGLLSEISYSCDIKRTGKWAAPGQSLTGFTLVINDNAVHDFIASGTPTAVFWSIY